MKCGSEKDQMMKGRSKSCFGRIADEHTSRLGLRTHQPIERHDVRDHQHWYIENRYRISCAQLPRQRRKTNMDGVVIVDENVDRPYQIESDDKQPEERTHPYRE